MKKLFASIVVAAIVLTGCMVTAPTKEELASANYGTVTFAQAERLIWEYLNRTLIDPDSARVGVTKLSVDYWARDKKGKFHYGKLFGFEVNAKNVYGGYTGKQRYYAFIENGQIVQIYDVLTDGESTYPGFREMN